MSKFYTLDNRKTVPCSLEQWGNDMRARDTRRVGETELGNVRISTVFLGLDHSFGGGGPPLLFETMVFGGPLDGEQERCTTWEQAEGQHAVMCERVRHAS